jgi:threonine/homoserine/homoserine lactone efflux protein
MLLFGLVNGLKKSPGPGNQRGTTNSGKLKLIIQGFFLNGINPFVLLFWFGMASMATIRYQQSGTLKLAFFSSLIGTVFTTDILKSLLAHRLRRLVTPTRMLWLNRLVGVALILFSLTLFHFAYKYWVG